MVCGYDISSGIIGDGLCSTLFQKIYCPHCNALLQPVGGVYPKTCVYCNKAIGYGKPGTVKPFFRLPDVSLRLKDIMVTIGLVGTLIYACVLIASSSH